MDNSTFKKMLNPLNLNETNVLSTKEYKPSNTALINVLNYSKCVESQDSKYLGKNKILLN